MKLLRRSATYYSRTCIPADLVPVIGRTEVLKSLRTRDAREARLRASMWRGHLAQLFTSLRKTHRTMDREAIDALFSEYLNQRLDDSELALALNTGLGREVRREEVNDELHRIEECLADGDHRETLKAAQEMLPGAPEEVVAVLARRLLEAKFGAYLAEMKAYEGAPLRQPVLVAAPKAKPAEKPSTLLSSVVAEYIRFHREGKAWALRTDRGNVATLEMVVALIGDRPVSSVTKEDMRNLRSLLARMPRHAVKRYKGLSPREAIEAADAKQDTDRLSPKTANMAMVLVRTLWKWAIDHDLATDNPTKALTEFNEKDAREQRDRFTFDQVRAILRVLEDERDDPAVWWVPRLMFATGARLEEISKLRPKDVREEHGITYLDINEEAGRLKTPDSARAIPVHPSLVPMLTAWRDKVATEDGPEANLWRLERQSDGTFSKYLSRTLNRRLEKAGAKSKTLVMESARNTFAANLMHDAGVPEPAVADLMGHKGGETLTGQRYIGRATLEQRAAIIGKLTVPLTVAVSGEISEGV